MIAPTPTGRERAEAQDHDDAPSPVALGAGVPLPAPTPALPASPLTLSMLDGYWLSIRDGDPRGRGLYLRHYSASPAARKLRDARGNFAQFIGPGEYTALLTIDCSALFVWRREDHRLDDEEGVNCAIFRNEGAVLSSDLIREACGIAWAKWPGERLFTFVDEAKTRRGRSKRSRPGECFIRAGWTLLERRSKKLGLRILEILPASEEL